MKTRTIITTIVFSLGIAACSGGSDSGGGISVSWDSGFERTYIDPEDDVFSSLDDEPTDVIEAKISQSGNKLKVEFDLLNNPSAGYLLGNECTYSVYFESDAVNLVEEDGLEAEVPVFLLASLSNCGNSLSCDLDEAKVSYGIYYYHDSVSSTSRNSFTRGRSFSDFVSEDGLIAFEIDRGDFGKSLSSIKQKNITTNEELGKMFTEDIVIASNHGIRMKAECDGAYDLVPNDGFSYE